MKLTASLLGLALLCLALLAMAPGFGSRPETSTGNDRSVSAPDDWPRPLLAESWAFYKQRFLVNGERVASNHYGGTISEGQSYALLKAVWMDDRETFDRVWQWTRTHMRRPGDRLFGWRWGREAESTATERLLETDNAADADQDIAFALLLAADAWNTPAYRDEARGIIADLWQHNVVVVAGRHYLVPGTWPGFREEYLTLNPSYFAPYLYRAFAHEDPAHATGWQALARDGYQALEACSALTAKGLPPNWCSVNWQTGAIGFSDKQGEGARDFGYDAFRVFWRMGLDARLGSAEARQYLRRHRFLLDEFHHRGALAEGYGPDGQPRNPGPSGFSHSAALALAHALASNQDAARTRETDYQQYQALLGAYYRDDGYWFNPWNDFLHSVIWLHLHTLLPSSGATPAP